ncbi:MAG: hypothetical protein LBC84_08315 [Prevotellaceae bacterium]|nr:hypothetical protein [Prevotellaceae bacterium]
MVTVIIKDQTAEARKFVEHVSTLPFATIVREKKKSFQEACADCKAVSVDSFVDELSARIEKWPDHACS